MFKIGLRLHKRVPQVVITMCLWAGGSTAAHLVASGLLSLQRDNDEEGMSMQRLPCKRNAAMRNVGKARNNFVVTLKHAITGPLMASEEGSGRELVL